MHMFSSAQNVRFEIPLIKTSILCTRVLLLLELDNRETGIRDKVQPKRSEQHGRREADTEAVYV